MDTFVLLLEETSNLIHLLKYMCCSCVCTFYLSKILEYFFHHCNISQFKASHFTLAKQNTEKLNQTWLDPLECM